MSSLVSAMPWMPLVRTGLAHHTASNQRSAAGGP